MINCREIESDLPLYFDGFLEPAERDALDAHLAACPLCRQKLDEYRAISNALNAPSAVGIPESLLGNIRAQVAYRLAASTEGPSFRLLEKPGSWVRVWLFPSSVGSFATIAFALLMLWFVVSSAGRRVDVADSTPAPAQQTVFIAGGTPAPSDYAAARRDVSAESPSVNPDGSLVELTRTLMSDEIKYDEVVVVADVYENGSARVAEVVEPSRDVRATQAIAKALESELAYAPFVPAYLDNRAETVRVVLRLQSVSVR